jgi:hypothetical protein
LGYREKLRRSGIMTDVPEMQPPAHGLSAEGELVELREGDVITDPDVLARVAELLLAAATSDKRSRE